MCFDKYHDILQAAKNIYEYCSVYEKAAPLKIKQLSENYRCLAKFNRTVLAVKYSEQHGFGFVTLDRAWIAILSCNVMCLFFRFL